MNESPMFDGSACGAGELPGEFRIAAGVQILFGHADQRRRHDFREEADLLVIRGAADYRQQLFQDSADDLAVEVQVPLSIEEIEHGRHIGGPRKRVQSRHGTDGIIVRRHRSGNGRRRQASFSCPALGRPMQMTELARHPSDDDLLHFMHRKPRNIGVAMARISRSVERYIEMNHQLAAQSYPQVGKIYVKNALTRLQICSSVTPARRNRRGESLLANRGETMT